MSAIVALVGRPNVGKSTLFNRLTHSRDALVADLPGLTRDRRYGFARFEQAQFIVVDTGGLEDAENPLGDATSGQTYEAIADADLVVLVLDARDGLNAADESIAAALRRHDKPVLAALNKIDGLDERTVTSEFFALGLEPLLPMAALRNRGIKALVSAVAERLPPGGAPPAEPDEGIRVAVAGRPNAGKSTLVNHLLGEQRVIASAQPGTTRDSVRVPFTHRGRRYTLIDTAGVRRRARVTDAVEKFSVVQTLQAIDASHVTVLLLDAVQGVAEQDLHLLAQIADAGRGVVVAVNKWDLADEHARAEARRELDRRVTFTPAGSVHFVSALHGTGIVALMRSVQRAYEASIRRFSPGQLTTLLEQALEQHPPPLVRGRRVKLRYAHQGGSNPPVIVIHGNQTAQVPDTYRRYLGNFFRNALDLEGTPLRLTFRSGENPFAGCRNQLTPRQQRKRRRVIRHNR